LRVVPAPQCRFLSPRAVAAVLGVCRDTIYRLIARGDLAATRVGSLLRIAEPDLDTYLRRQG
jgi:putative molybdopterin biosynthesis protein